MRATSLATRLHGQHDRAPLLQALLWGVFGLAAGGTATVSIMDINKGSAPFIITYTICDKIETAMGSWRLLQT